MAHAGDVTRPPKLSVPDVDIDCLKSQPSSKLRVADVVSPHMPARSRPKSQNWWFCCQLDILNPGWPSDPPTGHRADAQCSIVRTERRQRLRFDPWRMVALRGRLHATSMHADTARVGGSRASWLTSRHGEQANKTGTTANPPFGGRYGGREPPTEGPFGWWPVSTLSLIHI